MSLKFWILRLINHTSRSAFVLLFALSWCFASLYMKRTRNLSGPC